jgi:GH15 family glucan-1,4-alpha-glucosidase
MNRRIQDYALIGDLRTAALVGVDGAIDWLSLPRFDSPAVCAALLGHAEHGQWTLAPVDPDRHSQRRYRADTLVLETEWTTAAGVVRVTDLMVPGSSEPMVVRIVDGLVGSVRMRTRVAPRMYYGRDLPTLRETQRYLVTDGGDDELWLESDVDLIAVHGSWAGGFTVNAGERVSFTLSYAAGGERREPIPNADDALNATAAYWTEWSSRSTYAGRWEAEVKQSLILLKALTYAPTGSILAAATTSLPEQLGGSRNWDYRYSWLRDATFALRAFLATGHLEEVEAWRDWLVRTVIDNGSELQIMYAVDGTSRLPERTLDWLPGHAGSAPVRVGNAAATQQQNDVWGEVLDILSLARDAGVPDAEGQEKLEQILLDEIESHWRDRDHGLWEVRGPRRHFVHSKLLAWVGVDRAIRSLEQHETAEALRLARLRALRRTMAAEIADRGYHSGREAFTQSYGSSRLDAAVLLMPRYGFLRWQDHRMVATIDAIQRDLSYHGLLRRYTVTDDGRNVDGVPGSEGTFLAGSFWLADALHGIGRTGEAVELFERLLSLRNDVGLLSEEYDPVSGQHLGNTPQAFSHAGLIFTALALASVPLASTSDAPARYGRSRRGPRAEVA